MNDKREAENLDDKKKKNWGCIIFGSIGIAIFIIMAAIAIPNMIYVYPIPNLSDCSGNLRNLGIVITNYSTDHQGHYPQNLKVLEIQGFIKILPKCPKTDEDYIYEIHGWNDEDFSVFCPNPEKHIGSAGPRSVTESLFYHSGEGVKQVDK